MARRRRAGSRRRTRRRRSLPRRILRWAAIVVGGFYALCLLVLLTLRFVPPPTTMVQVQRRVEALASGSAYEKRRHWRSLGDLPPHVWQAVVAAEDTRFFQHWGFDWQEVRRANAEARRSGRPRRGASTITQQLVKNVFFTTHRSVVRKGLEATLTPLAELVLGKERILELYLNVIEWGPGVYGVEAAARYHYNRPADRLTSEQAARLAAVIPAPRSRVPQEMGVYAERILARMRAMGWAVGGGS